VADREHIIRELQDTLDAAALRQKSAARHLENVVQAISSGNDGPDHLNQLLAASREYSAAQDGVTTALLRLNYVLGLTDAELD
jgi:ABC-type transporter Mla subunit MlaD